MTAEELIEQLDATMKPRWELCNVMAGHKSSSVRESLAAHPSCPPDILECLSRDISPSVCEAVVRNPATPQPVLRKMISSKNQRILGAYCCNPAITPDERHHVLAQLATVGLRMLSDYNGVLNEDALRVLANSDNIILRQQAANRHELASDILEALTRDPDYEVRHATVTHPHLTNIQIQRLADDEDDLVSGNMACSGKLQTDQVIELLAHRGDNFRIVVARNHCDQQVLTHLFRSCCNSESGGLPLHVMHAMARNTATPQPILQRLYELDNSSQMQKRLIANHSIGGRLLCQLAFGSADQGVQRKACATLRSLDKHGWDLFVDEGLTLDTLIVLECDGPKSIALGDCLLKAGMSDAYQHLQARSLQQQVCSSTSQLSQEPKQQITPSPRLYF